LAGVPVYSAGPQVELLTPTGALLLSDYAKTFGAMPAMRIERVGYGAGTRDFSDTPNVLRVMIGERTAPQATADATGEVIVEIVCEIDDMSPQLFAPAMDRLFAAGALDVFLTPVQMKKNRPGILVTVLAPVSRRGSLADVLFRETTTIGVRFRDVRRETLDRTWEEVPVAGGTVRMKIATRDGERLNVVPEFDDCLHLATSTGRPIKEIQQEALHVWRSRSAAGG
jgi:uncharacterized protein (DUF111 family)